MGEGRRIGVTVTVLEYCIELSKTIKVTMCNTILQSWFRSEHGSAKIGSEESKKSLKQMSCAYHELSVAERQQLDTEAAIMNARRQKLLQNPIADQHDASEEAKGADLRVSQVHRLNQARLDKTLKQVIDHPAWRGGLGLSDHVSALKAAFVENCQLSDAEINEDFKQFMSYDPEVAKNTDTPPFSRPCRWSNGGLCQKEPLFGQVLCLVRQLDEALHARKLGGKPIFLKLTPAEAAASSSSDSLPVWILLGCVSRRPVGQIGICFYALGNGSFGIKVKNSKPWVETLHQTFLTLLRKYQLSDNDANVKDFGLHVPGKNFGLAYTSNFELLTTCNL